MWTFDTAEALKAFASRLAPFVDTIDFIALHGDLGAGKTAFAQGLLPALGVREGITSPTYGIVHAHGATSRTVFHCDFYRLGADDAEEIGFDEMCSTGVVAAEWPDALGRELPENRLDARIEIDGTARTIHLTGKGKWNAKLARFVELDDFVRKNGLELARCVAVRGDASARLFSRLERGDRTVMLMDWPPKPDGPPIRGGLAYSDIAHLAREGVSFIAVSEWLRGKAGLAAPKVFASDLGKGLFIVEDLGDAVFGALIAAGHPIEPLYAEAVDGLLALRASQPPQVLPGSGHDAYTVPSFDRQAFEVELELLLEWYFRLAKGEAASERLRSHFFQAWSPFFEWLDARPKTLVLRDYHSPNLILRDGHDGLMRLGVIDFQDALWGHAAYDLVSLLQDARLEVPDDVEAHLFARYREAAAKQIPIFDAGEFRKAYAILGAQRNTKILGIFARLSMRDGKHGYLAHLPRIARYLSRNLAHPDLKPLKTWYETHVFSTQPSEAPMAAEPKGGL